MPGSQLQIRAVMHQLHRQKLLAAREGQPGTLDTLEMTMPAAASVFVECANPNVHVSNRQIITVTCDPKWTEVGLALPAGAKWQKYPDIVMRVCMLKMSGIINDSTAHISYWCMQWRVRGLPHVQLILPNVRAHGTE